MGSVLRATINIVFSLILGALAFALVAVKAPEFMNSIQDVAETFRQFLTTKLSIPVEYNVWVRFLIQDQQLVFMFFVITTRILLAMLLAALTRMFTESDEQKRERIMIEEEDRIREKYRAEAEARVRQEFAAPAAGGSQAGTTSYP